MVLVILPSEYQKALQFGVNRKAFVSLSDFREYTITCASRGNTGQLFPPFANLPFSSVLPSVGRIGIRRGKGEAYAPFPYRRMLIRVHGYMYIYPVCSSTISVPNHSEDNGRFSRLQFGVNRKVFVSFSDLREYTITQIKGVCLSPNLSISARLLHPS